MFLTIFFELAPDGSFTIEEESTGINAEERAPSANNFLKLFGIIKTKCHTSACPPPPKIALITPFLTSPNNRVNNVQNIRTTEVKPLLFNWVSFFFFIMHSFNKN